MNRRALKITAWIVFLLAIAAVATVAPVDRTAIVDQDFYKTMQQRLANSSPAADSGTLTAGWSRVNITPEYPMPMAGYAPRKSFGNVHDSLFARVITLHTPTVTVSFVSIDLLLFPPALRDRLKEKMDSASVGHELYLSATHTHNGVGGWDDSLVGGRALGRFNRRWLETTATKLLGTLQSVQKEVSTIRYWQTNAEELVENRVDRENGKTDGWVRGIEIVRRDSTRAILYTFSAHPTNIDRFSRDLSGDYPAALTKKLEGQFDFAMFMAGMVGSHRFAWSPLGGYEFIDHITPVLSEKITEREQDTPIRTPRISFLSVPIEFGSSQLRISDHWKIRDWLFRSMLHPLKGNAIVTEIDNIIFIGLPCDFSGEIYNVNGLGELAMANGKRLIITSFNGDYDGYITLDRHYDVSKAEEIRGLNWVGPGYGEYFTSIVKAVVERRE